MPSAGQVPHPVYGVRSKSGTDTNRQNRKLQTTKSFKERLYEHRADLNKESSRINSTIAAHVWDEHIQYKVSWKLKDRATDFNPVTKNFRVCLKEKYHIMYKTDGSTLNSRSEVFNTCRHRKQKLLEKAKT